MKVDINFKEKIIYRCEMNVIIDLRNDDESRLIFMNSNKILCRILMVKRFLPLVLLIKHL